MFSYIPIGPVFINEIFIVFKGFYLFFRKKIFVINLVPLTLVVYGFIHLFLLIYSGGNITSEVMKSSPVLFYAIIAIGRPFSISENNVIFLGLGLILIESILYLLVGSPFGDPGGFLVYAHNSGVKAALFAFFVLRFFFTSKTIYLTLSILILLFILLENQRTGYVDILFIFLIFYIGRFGLRRTLFTFVPAFSILLFVLALSNETIMQTILSIIPNSEASKSLEFNSTNTRFEMYLVVLELLFMSLTYTDIIFGLGMGFDLIPDDIIHDLNNPHNGYLSILGRYGVFGLALFLFFCWYGIKKCFVVFKNGDSSDWFLPMIFISFVSDGFFQTSLDSPHTLVIFYLAASSLMGAYIEKATN